MQIKTVISKIKKNTDLTIVKNSFKLIQQKCWIVATTILVTNIFNQNSSVIFSKENKTSHHYCNQRSLLALGLV